MKKRYFYMHMHLHEFKTSFTFVRNTCTVRRMCTCRRVCGESIFCFVGGLLKIRDAYPLCSGDK